MRFKITMLLAASFAISLATPVPSDFNDIERRWSEGQSEAQIHAAHSIREATPAWPLVRASETEIERRNAFETTTDERTMLELQRRDDAGLIAKMRTFVSNFMAAKGETGVIDAREEAPVLKPRKGMRYRFTA